MLNEVIGGLILVVEAKRREQLELERKQLELSTAHGNLSVCGGAALSSHQRDSNPCLRSANQGWLRGQGVVRRPYELTPVALCQLDPGAQPLLRVQKPSQAH